MESADAALNKFPCNYLPARNERKSRFHNDCHIAVRKGDGEGMCSVILLYD